MLLLLATLPRVWAQGTAFTYSGVLRTAGNPMTGAYDFTFTLSANSNSLAQVGTTLTNLTVPVVYGVFTTSLDFGPGIFTGNPIWLEIGVRTNGSANFTPLSPLQPVEAVPYAILAGSASNLLGTLPAFQLSGAISPAQLPGTVLTNTETGVTLDGTFSGNAGGLTSYPAINLIYSVSTNPPVATAGTNFSLDFSYTKVIWNLTTNAFLTNTLNAASGDNHLEVWIRSTSTFTMSWLPTVNLVGSFTTNGLPITPSQGYWVMAVSQYGTNWNANTCTYAIVPPNR